MALVRSDLDFKLNSVNADNEGCYLITEAEVQSSAFLLVNIYAPNKVQEQCDFLETLIRPLKILLPIKSTKFLSEVTLMLRSTPILTALVATRLKRIISTKNISDLCLDFDLVDIWRIRNPETKRFTWRQKRPLIQRRLDYWLISDACQEDIERTDIISSINSDHSAIMLHFNNEFNTITDKRLFWDLIKYRIRQVSMEYGKEKACKKREKVTDIEASLKTCEETCAQYPSDENLQQLEYSKIEYDNLYENSAQGAII